MVKNINTAYWQRDGQRFHVLVISVIGDPICRTTKNILFIRKSNTLITICWIL